MKPDAEGIMKIPEKGRIDFSEHFLKERLFTNGIDHRSINNERQLENILQSIDEAEARKLKQEADRLGLNDPKKNKFMKEGEVIEVDFDKGRWNKAGGGLTEDGTRKDIRGDVIDYGWDEDNPEHMDLILKLLLSGEIPQFAQGGRAGIGYLLAEDTNERMPLAGGGYLPMGMWGDIAEAFEKYQEENKDSVGPLMSYKQFWNNYIDNLASGGRVGYAGGGSGKPPISGSAFVTIKGTEGSDVLQPGLTLNQKGYSGNVGGNINLPLGQGNIGLQGLLGFGRNKYNVDYQGQNVASGVGETKLGDVWNVGAEYNRPLFGGTVGIGASLDQDSNKNIKAQWRKPFAGGGMGRRAFLKLMAALGLTGAAAKSGLVTLFQKATPKLAKEVTQVPIKNIEGMPAWFKPLVNKVIRDGTEIPSGAERVITHKTKLPNSKTEVYVNQDLNTGDVTVDLGMEKHGFQSGKYGQPVRLEYKASETLEGPFKKGQRTKTKEEFNVEEAEFTGGHPENVKFEEVTVNKFGDHASDFDEVELFATGKVKKKK